MATPIPKNAASFTFGEIAHATSGQLLGADPAGQVHGVTSDSRALQPGELYVAIKGEHHDGHAFLAHAQAAGASAALVNDVAAAPEGLPLIVVADSRRALGDLARAHRRRWAGQLVAITGSAGKTTTKELTAAALTSAGRRVLATQGNLNNDIGLPMTLFGLSRQHDVAVVEIGTSGPGEIARLAEICEPNAGVVTTVALAHAERLTSLDAVADEKCALLRALPPEGVAIYGRDSVQLEARRGSFTAGRVIGFGEAAGSDLRLTRRELRTDMTTSCALSLAEPAGEYELRLKLFGSGPALDATAALALVFAWLGAGALPLAAAALAAVEPPPGRMRPYRGRGESLIVDDTYNANPASMRSSIGALAELARLRQGRGIVVLGDMAELGAQAEAEHVRLGLWLAQAGVAEAYLCGPLMARAAQSAREEVKRTRAKGPHVEHRDAALGALPELMRSLAAHDVVLVKGSRAMRMETVVDALRAGEGGGFVIYYLLYPLHEHPALSFLNVLRYVPFRVLAATMTAMLLTFGLYPWFIRTLQSKQIGQVVRKDGPASHFSKAGTPTMGGALILLAMIGSTVLWADPHNTMLWLVAAITVAYGLIGYVDDAAKIRKQHSGGLSARARLLLEYAIALGVCGYLWYGTTGLPDDWQLLRDRLAVPSLAFEKFPIVLPSVVYVAFAATLIVGMANAVNLTDGLDGLAIGPVIINAGTYLVFAYLAGATFFGRDLAHYLDIPSIASAGELAIYCGAMIGAGVGFLWYNTYPAQVFMGDVGSLALGGGLGALAVVTKNELLSLLLGGIFVIETVSVIGQVFAFKTFGRRIFLMAPIHHHFEKQGWAEPKIIVRFWIISIMLAIASLSTLKLR